MGRATAATVAIAGALVPSAVALPPQPLPGGPIELSPRATAAATATPDLRGSRPVMLRLTLTEELQCGRLRPGRLLITLPRAMSVPSAIAPSSIRLGGRIPASVRVSGTTVALGVAPAAGVTCDSIGPGRVSVLFMRDANIGNPAAAGRYRISIVTGGEAAVAALTIA